jgi:hypothetical protein
MSDENLINNENFSKLIDAYRKALIERYSHSNLEKYPILKKLDRNIIDNLILYFLELLYPPFEERKQLDNAFQSLNNFIHTPSKLFGVLGNLTYAVIQFGKMLISALQAGLNALRSYLAAHKFEKILYTESLPYLEKGFDISDPKLFQSLIAKIPKKDADEFREQVVKLFRTLSNKKLLEKVQDVMIHVIEKMESKPNLYSREEINGIRLGYSIIEKGKGLFENLPKEDIELILVGIDSIEKDFYEEAVRQNR